MALNSAINSAQTLKFSVSVLNIDIRFIINSFMRSFDSYLPLMTAFIVRRIKTIRFNILICLSIPWSKRT